MSLQECATAEAPRYGVETARVLQVLELMHSGGARGMGSKDQGELGTIITLTLRSLDDNGAAQWPSRVE